MKRTKPGGRPGRPAVLAVCAIVASMLVALPAHAADWWTVTPAQLGEKSPQVEKDADAEVVDWRVIGDDELLAGGFVSSRDHHVMIKIYTDKGRDEHSRVDIPYPRGLTLKGIRGRTILPDGKVLLLQSKDVYDRTLVQFGGQKISAKSFVLPGVVAGAVIEYAWQTHETIVLAERLDFQMDIPVRHVSYRIKPDPSLYYPIRADPFNGAPSTFRPDGDGYYVAELTDVHAFRREPYMPPDGQVEPWLLVYYQGLFPMFGPGSWGDFAQMTYRGFDKYLEPDDDIRAKARQLAAGATDTLQALDRLYEFCHTQLRNVEEVATDSTSGDDENRNKPSKTPAETLRRRTGDRTDIDGLFVSLARGLGYDARLALSGNRSKFFFRPQTFNSYFLTSYLAAVKVGGDWHFFNPAYRYHPFGMLPWQQEGLSTLLPDPEEALFVTTPLASEWASMETRTGVLHLAADGSLDGDATIACTGHQAVGEKEWNLDAAPDAREQRIRDHFRTMVADATISDVRLEHAVDGVDSVVWRFHVHAPAFAQVAGRRLLLRPAVFERDVPPRFSASDRHYSVCFPYCRSEYDSVRIELPEGYELDQAEVPESFKLGEFGSYTVDLAVTKEHPTLIYRRAFEVHQIFLGRDEYPVIKQAFDTVHERDQHTIALKPPVAAAH